LLLDVARSLAGLTSLLFKPSPRPSARGTWGVLETHAGRESIGQVPYIASEQRASTTIMP